ncbi:MAG TPA: ATP-grasp domain-containing protein [Thermoanaerobaculia bacterium]|nr:ATP-grasp domain-containing protein [Thermoanaerobaculia bacterium]
MSVIVLFGGRSDERHVSVASAQNIVRTLGSPLAWFWTPEGAVHDVAIDDLLAHRDAFQQDFRPNRPAIWPTIEQALDTIPVDDPVFLLALHGGEGEDGTVQRMLEERGIPFTASGSDASAKAFDKGRAKEVLRGKVRMAEERVVKNPREILDVARAMLRKYEKIVLKPLAGGSSRGLFFLERDADFTEKLDVPYIIEQFIAGREITDGVADMGEGAFALPVVEIEVDPGRAFDYLGKYLGAGTREVCPANIADPVRDDAQRTALLAHQLLGCEGYSRTDMIAAADGVYYLETNTLPGLTTSSLVPQELRAHGIEFRAFLERQMELARARDPVHT